MRLTIDARRRRRLPIDQPVGEVEPVRRRVLAAADAGTPARPASLPSPASGSRRASACVCRAVFARLQHQLRRAFADAAATVPRSRRFAVLPFRNRGAPVAEDGCSLRRRALIRWDGQNVADGRAADRRRRSGAVVTEKRKRPRLLFWLSSLFQPPCFCSR